jgi:hypothetical protein
MFINNININPRDYQETKPFPYCFQDNILEETFANELQNEILNISNEDWDRYDNPFEEKFTLRNKYLFPQLLNKLFEELESEKMLNKLSEICGIKLTVDPTRNFWGVHKYKSGDKLDIHVDAGLHPVTKQKKQVTFGIYLSLNWKEEYGCKLEVWKGDNASNNDAKIYEKADEIVPLFNRMIMFTCNDYAWHGNPVTANCPDDSKRIFITISYLSEESNDENTRVKAFFVARPEDEKDEEKDRLRMVRADPEKYKEIYRIF